MSDEVLQPNQPVKFASRNMHPSFKRLKAGDIFLVQVEVEESVWNSLRTVPDNALWENVAWWHDGDTPASEAVTASENGNGPKKEKPAKEPSQFGLYWAALHAKGFNNDLDLQEALNCTGDHVHESLRLVFEVEHLSTSVAPATFEKWLRDQGLKESLITMSRQAQVAALERAEKGSR